AFARVDGAHLVLVSRTPLTSAALRRIAPPDRAKIGIDDLRFRQDETAALFEGLASRDEGNAVHAFTAGWPVATMWLLHLAGEGRLAEGLALTRPADVARLLDFVGSQILDELSPEARAVMAGVARLRDASWIDVDEMIPSAKRRAVSAELAGNPLWSGDEDTASVHPIARLALAEHHAGIEALRTAADAAKRRGDHLRAAELLVAAGSYDDAAAVLDGKISIFLLHRPSAAVAEVVAALPKETLVRFPALWNATALYRAFAMSGTELLAEGFLAWEGLTDATPPDVALGVATTHANSLVMLGRADEALAVLGAAEKRYALTAPPSSMMVAMWRAFIASYSGRSAGLEELRNVAAPLLDAVPLIASVGELELSRRTLLRAGAIDRALTVSTEALRALVQLDSGIFVAIHAQNVAFWEWVFGRDEGFERALAILRDATTPATRAGTRMLQECAQGDPLAAEPGAEMLYLRAQALLVGAARVAPGPRRGALLAASVYAGGAAGEPMVEALARLAELLSRGDRDPQKLRAVTDRVEDRRFGEALSDALAWPPRGPYAPFAQRFSHRPIVMLGFGNAHGADGGAIGLSRGEIVLLVALATFPRPVDGPTLAEMLWPDARPKAARANLRVHVSRVRTRLRPSTVIESQARGYRLGCDVRFVVNEAEEMVRGWASGALPRNEERERAAVLVDGLAAMPAWILDAPWFEATQHRAGYLRRALCERLLADALARADDRDIARFGALVRSET
ncbi:MAG: transcriptional activator domain protein, partial [Candidatus Eremiobacteraeota bacterium]|nr:transcriptional activator domain protein [Candidatus Eremiobacteraeota bacterium]